MSTENTIQIPPHEPVAAPQAGRVDAYQLVGVGRTYSTDAGGLDAVKSVDLATAAGEYVVIEGPSGSGKSTLLQLMGMLDSPSRGTIRCAGHEVSTLSERELAGLRLQTIGFVFQQFNLIPTLTAQQNIEIAMYPSELSKSEAAARALELLGEVGLAARAAHYPAQLSGGEQQRVAIARALANRPQILLADEPTGNLDSATSVEILELLDRLHADGLTVILITHDRSIAARASRSYTMRDGELVAGVSV